MGESILVPRALHERLHDLLDRQDQQGRLPPKERREANALAELAAKRQDQPVYRISFIDAVRWLAQAAYDGDMQLLLGLVPDRPSRAEPRAVKRRPKEYDRLNKPRDVLRKALLNRKHAV